MRCKGEYVAPMVCRLVNYGHTCLSHGGPGAKQSTVTYSCCCYQFEPHLTCKVQGIYNRATSIRLDPPSYNPRIRIHGIPCLLNSTPRTFSLSMYPLPSCTCRNSLLGSFCASKHHNSRRMKAGKKVNSLATSTFRHGLHFRRPVRYGGSRISTLVLRPLSLCLPAKFGLDYM